MAVLLVSLLSFAMQRQTAAGASDLRTITIDLLPRMSTVVVDGKLYLQNDLPLTFSWTSGTIHHIAIEKSQVRDGSDKMYVFQRWTDLSEDADRSFVAYDNLNLRAIFEEQYQLKINSEYGEAYGVGWYQKGETATFGITPTTILDKGLEGHKYSFSSWDKGDSPKSASNSILIQGPTVVKAIWYDQYYLEATSSLKDKVVADSGWYDKGQKVKLPVGSEVDTESPEMKYAFDGWSSVGEYSASITPPRSGESYYTLLMDHPLKVEAKWKKAYSLEVQSPYATTTGSGFYGQGSVATVSVSPSELVTKQNKERLVFDSWSGKGILSSTPSGSGQVRVTEPATVIAKWKPQYYLSITSEAGSVPGSGWYDAGSVATVSAADPPNQLSGFWMKTVFDRWVGDSSANTPQASILNANTPQASILMDSPKTVKVQLKTDYSPALINGGILAGVAVAGIVAFSKFRKPKKSLTVHRPKLGGGLKQGELSEPTWQSWRAKIVDRSGTEEFEPSKP